MGVHDWWLCMGDIVFGYFLGVGMIYLLARRRTCVAKSCMRVGD